MIFNRPTRGQLAVGVLGAAILLLAEKLIPGSHHEGEHEGWLRHVPFLGAVLGMAGSLVLVAFAKAQGFDA